MKENIIQIKNGIMINVDVSIKTSHMWKDYFRNAATCSGENEKYLASIIDDDSLITCDEIKEESKTISTNLMKNKQPVKHKMSIFYLHFH